MYLDLDTPLLEAGGAVAQVALGALDALLELDLLLAQLGHALRQLFQLLFQQRPPLRRHLAAAGRVGGHAAAHPAAAAPANKKKQKTIAVFKNNADKQKTSARAAVHQFQLRDTIKGRMDPVSIEPARR